MDQSHAISINKDANKRIEEAAKRLDVLRKQCGDVLRSLGEEKVFVLNNEINEFITFFRQIKNVDFSESEGITELHKLKFDQNDFSELAEMTKFSLSLAQGGISGAVGGALAAFGAYSAATHFAVASTGTAISA